MHCLYELRLCVHVLHSCLSCTLLFLMGLSNSCFRLKKFDSGVLVVELVSHSEDAVIGDTRQLVCEMLLCIMFNVCYQFS